MTSTRVLLGVLLLAGCRPKDSSAPAEHTKAPVVAGRDAGPCPDLGLVPGPVLTGADSAPVLLMGDVSAHFFVDGKAVVSPPEAPQRLTAGDHVVRVELPPLEPAEFTVRVTAFKPGLIEAQGDGPTVTAVLQGVSCATCPSMMTNADVAETGEPQPDALDVSARALRSGQWRPALDALRTATPTDRKKSRFNRQLAVLSALAGRPSEANRLLTAAKDDYGKSFRRADEALAVLLEKEPTRQATVAVQRWNALTDRYTRLSDAFGVDAPGTVGPASSRINQLSAGFSKAAEANDVIEQEATAQAALEVLATMVKELRQLKPTDCGWQARITAAQ